MASETKTTSSPPSLSTSTTSYPPPPTTSSPPPPPPFIKMQEKVSCTTCKKTRNKEEMHWVKWSYGDAPHQSFEFEYWCKDNKKCEPCFL